MGSSASWNLANGHGYILDRNFRAASRLNLQHYLWREVFQFTIHSSVKFTSENPFIADVASGTGLWLVDAAREMPQAEIHGLDIDITQTPHKSWLPDNIQMSEWNIFDDVPAHLEGKFDFVHTRLLVCVLSGGEDYARAVQNLFKLLKPGGYLQWDDVNTVDMRVKKVDPAVHTPALDELLIAGKAGGRHDWVLDLPRMLEQTGFEHSTIEHFDEKPELVRAFSDLHLLTIVEFADRLMQVEETDGAQKMYELIQKADLETVAGSAFHIPRVVVVARKPTLA